MALDLYLLKCKIRFIKEDVVVIFVCKRNDKHGSCFKEEVGYNRELIDLIVARKLRELLLR